MKPEIFKYKNGYDYDEYKIMCDRFKKVRFPFLGDYSANSLLADYIFSISMDRMRFGVKNTLRRFFGGMFTYSYKASNVNKNATVFVFSLDGVGRPDYVRAIKKVAAQCDEATVLLIDRTHPKLNIKRILCFIPELCWAYQINKIVCNFNISLDMAIYLYRAKHDGLDLYEKIKCFKPNGIVTFCDFTPIEGLLTQRVRKDGIKTATLQHGNGNNIFYGSCSDYYLANSRFSCQSVIECGIPDDKVLVIGPMKYAGEKYEYKKINSIQKIGIVFDGADNYPHNAEMIQVIHEAVKGEDIKCCIRFHPNNKREDYKSYLFDNDVIYDDLQEFEKDIDLCLVYNSSMYTDMIFKRIPVYRFKNGKVDLFQSIQDEGFTNKEELLQIFQNLIEEFDKIITEQKKIYDVIFGLECQADSYRRFFEETFK